MGGSDLLRRTAMRRWATVTAVSLAVAGGSLGLGSAATAHAATGASPAQTTVEDGTWGASTDRTGGTITNQTVRDIVRTSIGGSDLRVKLSNVFGSQPVTFGDVSVGVVQSGAALVPGSSQEVTFSGNKSVTVPAGAEVLSDPLPGNVPAQSNLAVSIFVQGASGTVTGHNLATQTNFVSTDGDHAGEDAATAFTTSISRWYYLDGLFVNEPRNVGTVVALGDSITDGFRSTVGANNRWPDFLARRLLTKPAAQQDGVLNEGISGNRVLTDGAGVSALNRFDRDVLAQPNAKTIIFLEGINDLSGGATADQVIAGDRQIIARAHAANRCIIGATLTPFGTSSANEQAEVLTVNNFIRSSGEFDSVVDFNKAVADPSDPNRMLPAFDSGDGLHPNDAGYQAMANAINLKALSCKR
ncbi:MAG: SGNH/GDSL hydrolase family protein [Nocardiopsaceae bacterium]|nr:SGNH/GDSL hydrolase family protein [Nocardiopsaceae bacterium]